MLRDERLQKVVAEIDGAPDRERVSRARFAACQGLLELHGQMAGLEAWVGRPAGPSVGSLTSHLPASTAPPRLSLSLRCALAPLPFPAQALLRALQAPNFKEFTDKASWALGGLELH